MSSESGRWLSTREGLERLERALVVLIALHSVVVGLFLSFATAWGARFGGFPDPVPLFFPRQAGAFHFVVAGVYLLEYFVYRGVLMLVMTKSIAVVFLGLVTFLCPVPWVVPLSGAGDALMGLAVVWMRRRRRLPLAGSGARGTV
jgi:hypothetical protein